MAGALDTHLLPGRSQALDQLLGLLVVVPLDAGTAVLPVQDQLHLLALQALLPFRRQRQLLLVPGASQP